MALNYTDVSAGDTILAAHPNALLDDIEQHTHEGTDTSKVLVQSLDADSGVLPAGAVGANSMAIAATFEAAVTRYWTCNGSAFTGEITTDDVTRSIGVEGALFNTDAGFVARNYVASVNLPHGAVVTQLRMYYDQLDNAASVALTLYRTDMAGTARSVMATCIDQNIASAQGTHDDDTIINGTIDNSTYSYYMACTIDNNAITSDAVLSGVRITYTVTVPAP